MEALDDLLSRDPSLDWLGVLGVAGFEIDEATDAGGVGSMAQYWGRRCNWAAEIAK